MNNDPVCLFSGRPAIYHVNDDTVSLSDMVAFCVYLAQCIEGCIEEVV